MIDADLIEIILVISFLIFFIYGVISGASQDLGISEKSESRWKIKEVQKRRKLRSELRAIDSEFIAIENQADYSSDGSNISGLLKINPHNLKIKNEQITNVITEKFGKYESHIFDFSGQNYHVPIDKGIETVVRVTGLALVFQNSDFSKFLISKNTLSPGGFWSIDQNKYPDWFSKEFDIYSMRDNSFEVLEWVVNHESLADILQAPNILLLQGQGNLLEAYFEDQLPAISKNYLKFKRQADLIAGLRAPYTSFFDTQQRIKMLKENEKRDEVE